MQNQLVRFFLFIILDCNDEPNLTNLLKNI